MTIIPSSSPLKDLDISASVLTDIYIEPDEKQEIDSAVTKSSNNPVESQGIWSMLETLSGDILSDAYEHDISCEFNGIIADGQGAVKSGDAWTFLHRLSNYILESISSSSGSIAVIDDVLSDNQNAVKSEGIYRALETLSTLIIETIHVPTYHFADFVTEDSSDAVKSSGIYNALSTLSDDLKQYAESIVHPIDLNIDPKVTETGTNVVSGCGIYEALSTLSNDVLTEAYTKDLSLQINLTETGEKPVASKTIWMNLNSLSTNILLCSQYNLEQLSNQLCSEIISLSSNLSNDIYNLSTRISSDVITLSANLSNDIGNIYTKLSSTLSSIENEPIASLTYNSDIDDIISSVLEIRTILSSLYYLVKA